MVKYVWRYSPYLTFSQKTQPNKTQPTNQPTKTKDNMDMGTCKKVQHRSCGLKDEHFSILLYYVFGL